MFAVRLKNPAKGDGSSAALWKVSTRNVWDETGLISDPWRGTLASEGLLLVSFCERNMIPSWISCFWGRMCSILLLNVILLGLNEYRAPLFGGRLSFGFYQEFRISRRFVLQRVKFGWRIPFVGGFCMRGADGRKFLCGTTFPGFWCIFIFSAKMRERNVRIYLLLNIVRAFCISLSIMFPSSKMQVA